MPDSSQDSQNKLYPQEKRRFQNLYFYTQIQWFQDTCTPLNSNSTFQDYINAKNQKFN